MANLDENGFNSNEVLDDSEALYIETKTTIECLCPKCGCKHMMNIHWIGRGVPRKFCKQCRSVTHDFV